MWHMQTQEAHPHVEEEATHRVLLWRELAAEGLRRAEEERAVNLIRVPRGLVSARRATHANICGLAPSKRESGDDCADANRLREAYGGAASDELASKLE